MIALLFLKIFSFSAKSFSHYSNNLYYQGFSISLISSHRSRNNLKHFKYLISSKKKNLYFILFSFFYRESLKFIISLIKLQCNLYIFIKNRFILNFLCALCLPQGAQRLFIIRICRRYGAYHDFLGFTVQSSFKNISKVRVPIWGNRIFLFSTRFVRKDADTFSKST